MDRPQKLLFYSAPYQVDKAKCTNVIDRILLDIKRDNKGLYNSRNNLVIFLPVIFLNHSIRESFLFTLSFQTLHYHLSLKKVKKLDIKRDNKDYITLKTILVIFLPVIFFNDSIRESSLHYHFRNRISLTKVAKKQDIQRTPFFFSLIHGIDDFAFTYAERVAVSVCS